MSALSGAHAGQLDALAITLQLAVPLQIWELRHCDDQQRVASSGRGRRRRRLARR